MWGIIISLAAELLFGVTSLVLGEVHRGNDEAEFKRQQRIQLIIDSNTSLINRLRTKLDNFPSFKNKLLDAVATRDGELTSQLMMASPFGNLAKQLNAEKLANDLTKKEIIKTVDNTYQKLSTKLDSYKLDDEETASQAGKDYSSAESEAKAEIQNTIKHHNVNLTQAKANSGLGPIIKPKQPEQIPSANLAASGIQHNGKVK